MPKSPWAASAALQLDDSGHSLRSKPTTAECCRSFTTNTLDGEEMHFRRSRRPTRSELARKKLPQLLRRARTAMRSFRMKGFCVGWALYSVLRDFPCASQGALPLSQSHLLHRFQDLYP